MVKIKFIDVVLYAIVVPIVTIVFCIVFTLIKIDDKLHPDLPMACQEESLYRKEYPSDFDGFLLTEDKK